MPDLGGRGRHFSRAHSGVAAMGASRVVKLIFSFVESGALRWVAGRRPEVRVEWGANEGVEVLGVSD
jgi:hypothetical protein